MFAGFDADAIFVLSAAVLSHRCPRLLNGKQLLGQADASGALLLYDLQRSTENAATPALSLLHSTQVDEKASCLSLDWSNRKVAESVLPRSVI